MMCWLFKFFYRIVPFNFIKAIIINKHFAQCPNCGEVKISDEQIKDDLKKLENSVKQTDLWPGVERGIRIRKKVKKNRAGSFLWRYAAVAGLLLVLVFSFNLLNRKNNFIGEKVKINGKKSEEVVVKFIEIDGKEARGFFYNSDNRDRLIVWAQKNKED
ncbi:MAG: hypothetical protein ABFR75_10650 [Acidobacteriota bacterium]